MSALALDSITTLKIILYIYHLYLATPSFLLLLSTCHAMLARVFFPTGHSKPEHSGSGKSDRFDRLPVETGQIQI